MRAWLGQLDDLLRGKKTGPDLLTSGGLQLPLRSFVPFAVMLGAIYGFFMGWFAVLHPEPNINSCSPPRSSCRHSSC